MYALALTSLIFAAMFRLNGDLTWISKIYITCFCISSLGFELWFNFAIAGGETMDVRQENEEMDALIPYPINWAMNASIDAGFCMLAVLVLEGIRRMSRLKNVFERWRWVALIPLYILFFAQAIILPQRWAPGELSWAPFAPLGEAFNPCLFNLLGNDDVTVNRLCPWLFMSPIAYGVTLWILYRKRKRRGLRKLQQFLVCKEEDEEIECDRLSVATV